MKTIKCYDCNGKREGRFYNTDPGEDSDGRPYPHRWEKWRCSTCDATGELNIEFGDKCTECDGKGQIIITRETGSFIPGFRTSTTKHTCEKCHGYGRFIHKYEKCGHCKKGYRDEYKEVKGVFGWTKKYVGKKKCTTCNGTGWVKVW